MMEIVASEEGEVTILHCSGRFNMVSAPRLKAAVDDAVRHGHARIVVDLAEVTFIDSSGLGSLVAGLKATRQASGDLRIAAPAPQVMTVLDLTNLSRILHPYPTAEEAMTGW